MSMQTPTGGANYGRGSDAGLITSATPVTGARVPLAGGLARIPETKRQTESALAQSYRRMSPALRQALAQQLKDAGYGNPVTSEFNIKVREAFLNASRDLNDEITFRLQADPSYFDNNKYDLTTFLREQSNAGAGNQGPTTIRYRREMTPDAIKATINEVFTDVLGRGASEDEVVRYTERIQTKLGKTKNMPSTTYRDVGGGVQEQIQRPGFNPQVYLYEQLSNNNEAKQRSIFNFYDAFKRALGV